MVIRQEEYCRQSWYVMGESILTIMKGPSRFGANFRLAMEHLRFLASSQTLSSLAKRVKPQLLCEDITWQASLWAARALSQVATRDFRQVSTTGMEELEIKEGRA